ncbi:MAG TPA: aldo/keto reductase [Vicinamibacterales bacterium]|nr:aldo/keto reductase [Vicinamibacterales bacterium]
MQIGPVNRREFLGTLGAGTALALTPQLLRAFEQTGGKLIQRAIPSTGEMVPALGLSFSNHPGCADHAALTQVLKAFADGGGRVYDAMHVNPASEQFHITAATELGIQNRLFWSTRATPGNVGLQAGTVNTHVDSLLARLKVSKIDLVMLPTVADAAVLAALKEEKKAGRVRYIAVQTIVVKSQAAQLEAIMRNEPIDFIGVDYDVSNRFAEDKILPLAQERKIGVMAFFPLSNSYGMSCTGSTQLFKRAGDRPLPEWAADFDAKTWSQFFLKYVISHPAVTVARPGTTKPAHMIENIGGGIGRLPNEAMRKRMAEFVDALPPAPPPPAGPPPLPPGIALPVAVIERYVGEYTAASGFTATFRREGDRLLVKPGNNPEVPLLARSETRFQDPRGPFFEFQLDAQGNVTGAILEQQGAQGVQKIPLTRK